MVQHLYALFMARVIIGVETGFYWPTSVMSRPPFTYYFIPNYFLAYLRFSAILELVCAIGKSKLGNQLGIGFMFGCIVIGVAIIPILTGALFPITLSQEWLEYLRHYISNYTPQAR